MSELPTSQYTGTFLELLEKAGISLVVSTYQANKLVLLRAQGGRVNTHFVRLKKPMGMAFQGLRLSVGSGNRVIDYFHSASAARKVAPTNTHDAAFLPRNARITGDIDVHEMAFDHEKELWIVNTRMSCLCTLDAEHSFVPRWRPPFVSAYDSSDRCHLNGLAMREGKPRYVTALGTTDTTAGWRSDKAFGGVVMDIGENRVIADGLSMPHSPRWYRGQLWVLESGAGRLLRVDLETGEPTVVAEVPGFCRGLDFVDRYALIGLSEVRETAVFAGLPLTAREQNRKCGIWVVDIETGQTAGFFEFTSGVQELFAVQSLPMKFPTLLDFDDPLLNTTYSVPGSVINEFAPADPRQIRIDQATEHHRRKEFGRAIEQYRSLLDEDPNDTNLQFALAEALSRCGLWDEVVSRVDQVLVRQANHAQANCLRGRYFQHRNELDQAVKCYEQAIATDRQYADAHYQRGCVKLSQGDFEQGWEGYEWRTQRPGLPQVRLPHPRWSGEKIADKTLLVLTEQSAAEAVFFARLLPLARQRCSKLIVVCQESLRLLFQGNAAVNEVHLHGELPIDLFDVYVSIQSLGAVLRCDAEHLSMQRPYLCVPQQLSLPDLVPNASEHGRELRIGLAWSASNGEDQRRSCPLAEIITLTPKQKASYYSFQSSPSAVDQQLLQDSGVTDLGPELKDLAHTGALLRQMDLLICADNATAHLAGALGVRSIVIFSEPLGWQWAEESGASLYYPSIEILHKDKPNDWSCVLHHCTRRIDEFSQQSV